MTIGGAFLGGGVEVVPAGSCKLELEILTEDRANLGTTFTISGGGQTYTVTAGADGRAVKTVPSGVTYTVSVNTTGYDNLASQTVVAESGTVRYVRFEAFEGRVKRSGDTMSGLLDLDSLQFTSAYGTWRFRPSGIGFPVLSIYANNDASKPFIQMSLSSNELRLGGDLNRVISNYPIGNDDNSKTVATTEWVNGASSVVHTSNDEVIQGYKKFSKSPMTTAWTGYHITLPDMTKGEKVLELNTNLYTGFFDKNDTGLNRPANMMAGLRFTVPPGTESAPPNTFIELSNQYYRDTYLRLYDNGTTAYATCPNPPSDATTNQITTAGWTIGKFVQKSGDTMTGNLTIKRNVPTLIQASTNTSSDISAGIGGYLNIAEQRYVDSSDDDVVKMRVDADTTYSRYYIMVRNYVNGVATDRRFDFYNYTDGTSAFMLPQSPSSKTDNSTKVATTAWVNSADSVLHKTGNESIAGVKTFTGITYLNTSYGNLRLNMHNLLQSSTPPTSRQVNYTAVKGLDKDGNESTVWQLETIQGTDGIKIVQLATNFVNWDDGTSNWMYPFRVIQQADKSVKVTTVSPKSDANSNEIATADWVNNKLATKNKKTTFSTWAELEALIMAGKPGDSFNVTVDFTATSILGGSEIKGDNSGPVDVHGFGHFFIDEVSSTKVEAFGAGEVSGNFDGIGNSTESYGTTGFGAMILNGVGMWAFRAPYAGSTAQIIFNPSNTAPTSCTGYYLSI